MSVNRGLEYTLSNRGTAAVTLSPAGADTLATGAVTTASITIPPGSTITVVNDGSTWIVDGLAGRQLASGRYYGIPLIPFAAANPNLNRLRLVPWIVPETGLYDRIASRVTTAAAGATLRWGMYREVGGLPVTQVFDTGAVGDASTVGLKEATISQILQGGERMWLGLAAQGADGAAIVLSSGSTSAPDVGVTAADIVATGNGIAAGYYVDGVTGALPNPLSTYNVTTGAPGIWLRKA
ncbi:hypothetical protein ZANY_6 [Gordonia phage Zany]|uniref:Uncharacterized protein n=1 Tax=Gordonia phage Zany TaxID=2910759 RepID=A0AA49BNZ0_9CAUD|nr:hypothetical protein ZANY_6 [Gordonia phage Zany]